MESINIEKATIKDLDKLQAICKLTFSQTFLESNAEENMRKYLNEKFSSQQMLQELEKPDSSFYLAILDEKVIGYLKLNFGHAQTESIADNAMEIERIYVLKDYHGKKVGQMLYEKALQVANDQKADLLWLGVWEENLRAISFYKKNGFVAFDKHIFKLGDDEQTDIMMKLQLN